MTSTRDETQELLNQAVANHIQACFEDSEDGDVDFFINQWGIVINIGTLETGRSDEYYVKFNIASIPPHAMKGLLQEGIDEIDRLRCTCEEDH